MSAVDDVYDYLETESIAGGGTAWSLARRRVADEPLLLDQLVTVTEDGGAPPEIKENKGIGDSAMHDVGVLVTVRGNPWEGDENATKAKEILTALHGQRSITVGTTTYLRVRARMPEPVFAGYDERGRPRHTVAFLLLYEVGS